MGNELGAQAGHSAEYFGDTRDHWWNPDFLELMARRWRLDAVRDVLDVGCGVGHWGLLLASVLPEQARLTGVDREPRWVELATARAAARGLGGRFSYRTGEVERLPFPDDTFDLTTCQTLLIHLPDPAAGLREMTRVTRPGGLVVVAEPNNLTGALLLDSVSRGASVEQILELVRLQLICERGKVALGEGDNSLGDRVPELYLAGGLTDIEVYVNDKTTLIVPPYASAEQRAFREETHDRTARRHWIWSEPETRRFFLAGGGLERDFPLAFERALAAREQIVRGLSDGSYHALAGGAFYLVSGRKSAPAEPTGGPPPGSPA